MALMDESATRFAVAGDLSIEELGSLLDEMAPHLRFCWAEGPATAALSAFEAASSPSLQDAGRAFGPECEVRWIRRGARAHAMVTTDGPRPARSLGRSLDLTACEIEAASYPLWGEYSPEDEGWREERIPRTLSYPVPSESARVLIDAVVYRDRDTGQLVASRFAGLRGENI